LHAVDRVAALMRSTDPSVAPQLETSSTA
jgi:hypothetical protein